MSRRSRGRRIVAAAPALQTPHYAVVLRAMGLSPSASIRAALAASLPSKG